jgi:hypothetical protein
MSNSKWIVKAIELWWLSLNTKNRRNYLTVLFNLKKVYASNKTNDGNKPNAILSTIAITATA